MTDTSATCEIFVTVQDVNDNAPEFETSEYRVEIDETKISSDIVKLRAIDKDFGENARILYEITSGDRIDLFTIDSISGQLSFRNVTNIDAISGNGFRKIKVIKFAWVF